LTHSPTGDLVVFMPAYRAERHLEATVARIPEPLWSRIRSVRIVDDGSDDGTAAAADRCASRWPVVHRHSFPVNRGYGAAVLAGLQHARDDRGARFALCLHADGQYAPESIPALLEAAEAGLDLVQGSRHRGGTALRGGMPVYKWAAGRALTALENAAFGLRMTDYHSGMLLYGRRVLDGVPFERLSGSFDFDLEVIACSRSADLRVGEVAIPTRYADEVSHLSPIPYGLRCLRVVARYLGGRYRRMLADAATRPPPAE
jgi:glycosyltransferase involved in cell wall biosynthesis